MSVKEWHSYELPPVPFLSGEGGIDIKIREAYAAGVVVNGNFKKALATAATIALATAALSAGAALTYNLTSKVIDSCYCQPMGAKMICSGTCQAAGECCCCMPQMNR